MAAEDNKLGDFLREVSGWDWEAFCRAENDPSYSSNEAMIFTLIRACAMQKMDAIKLALNRIDGKLKTPVRIEMPKVFFLYPEAKLPATDATYSVSKQLASTPDVASVSVELERVSGEVLSPANPQAVEEKEIPLEELSLRQTLARMSDAPREVPEYVIQYAHLTQQWLNGQAEEPDEKPMVKSVVAAHLLQMAQNRNITALAEVFDQIDGKLVETIQVLGEDIFITNYSLIAPDGAYLNADGILQLEATQSQDIWTQKLTGNIDG